MPLFSEVTSQLRKAATAASYLRGGSVGGGGGGGAEEFWVLTASRELSHIDLTDMSIISTISLGGSGVVYDISFDADGNFWGVNSSTTIRKYSGIDGSVLDSFVVSGVSVPQGIAVDANGDLLIASATTSIIKRYNTAGVEQDSMSAFTGMRGLSIDGDGGVWYGQGQATGQAMQRETYPGSATVATVTIDGRTGSSVGFGVAYRPSTGEVWLGEATDDTLYNMGVDPSGLTTPVETVERDGSWGNYGFAWKTPVA